MKFARALIITALSLAVLCLTPADGTAQGQERIKRLVLTDGSFELILQYEIRGDRIRYLSADRHEWEEMPNSLVDWPATEKYAKDETRARTANSKAGKADDPGPPQAAPGITLPADGGVFLLDEFQGTPELIGLQQSGADVNKNTARNILRASVNPIAGSKQTIELKGGHALVQAHVPAPSIYILLEAASDSGPRETSEKPADRYHIVKCEEKNGNRVVGAIDIAVYGKVKQQANVLETRTEAQGGEWVRITPAAPLQPGEYALVEMLGKEGMNQFVWDFGVNPSAPENASAIKPDPARQPPVLLKKAKKPAGIEFHNFVEFDAHWDRTTRIPNTVPVSLPAEPSNRTVTFCLP